MAVLEVLKRLGEPRGGVGRCTRHCVGRGRVLRRRTETLPDSTWHVATPPRAGGTVADIIEMLTRRSGAARKCTAAEDEVEEAEEEEKADDEEEEEGREEVEEWSDR